MENAYCNICQRETPHVVTGAPGDPCDRKDFYACFTCGEDRKRLYQDGKKLALSPRAKEGQLAPKTT